jgi:catechol 2,3-dioxygenase-like lactoylglutathione lyase family enzyme
MFSYLTLGGHDLSASRAFYDPVLKTVGLTRLKTADYELGYGPAGGETWLWVVKPQNELPATYGNGTMLAFAAPDRAAVDAFHAAAIANGGYDEGKPGLRSYGPNWYACYVRDPAGNKLSAVYNKPVS